MSTLKIRKIGNSLGVVLPKAVLARLRVGEGDVLSLAETPAGVELSAYDESISAQMEVARDLMRRYRNALRELAK
jgi:putative addiction module antidote